MGDRLNAHCKSLQALDWSASRDGVNEYMTVLVKETVTLHKVLSRYLQESVLEVLNLHLFTKPGCLSDDLIAYYVSGFCYDQS